MKIFGLLAMTLAACTLSACGQKGPLVLPDAAHPHKRPIIKPAILQHPTPPPAATTPTTPTSTAPSAAPPTSAAPAPAASPTPTASPTPR